MLVRPLKDSFQVEKLFAKRRNSTRMMVDIAMQYAF